MNAILVAMAENVPHLSRGGRCMSWLRITGQASLHIHGLAQDHSNSSALAMKTKTAVTPLH